VFTVEEETEPDRATSYTLQPHGRYTHGAEYVRRLLLDAGLQPSIGRGELRLESGLPVGGLVVRGSKPGTAGMAADAGVTMGEHHA
jgi:predicted TPR repeat methyltransferase